MKRLMHSIALFACRFIMAITFGVVVMLLLSACLMCVWNLTIAPELHIAELTITGAFGVIAVASIVFAGARSNFKID